MAIDESEDRAEMPFVSVIVPLYQGEQHIEATLDSLHLQSDPDLEVIVIDDGSTDRGRRLAESHPVGAQVVRQGNKGVAAARNRGSALARGTWLAFLDQDDLWHHRRLERIRPFLETTSNGFISTTMRCFALASDKADLDDADELIGSMVDHWVGDDAAVASLAADPEFYDNSSAVSLGQATLEDVLGGTLSTTTSFFVHADHLRLLGGWSMHARSIDDWWLMASAAYLEPIVRIDEPGHLYRIHAGATSRSTNFWYAYSSSLAAIRLGGNFVSRDEALSSAIDNPMAEHMLGRMIASEEWVNQAGASGYSRHIAAILWPGRSLTVASSKARLRRLAPWLVAVRDRLGPSRSGRGRTPGDT